jgi:hypothetical protein
MSDVQLTTLDVTSCYGQWAQIAVGQGPALEVGRTGEVPATVQEMGPGWNAHSSGRTNRGGGVIVKDRHQDRFFCR